MNEHYCARCGLWIKCSHQCEEGQEEARRQFEEARRQFERDMHTTERQVAVFKHMRDCWPELPPHTVNEHEDIIQFVRDVEREELADDS